VGVNYFGVYVNEDSYNNIGTNFNYNPSSLTNYGASHD